MSFDSDVVLSQMNEYEVLQLLMGDCRERIAAYPTSQVNMPVQRTCFVSRLFSTVSRLSMLICSWATAMSASLPKPHRPGL